MPSCARTTTHHRTGPRTAAGKARSSQNALRHGPTAHTVVLPSEDMAIYQTFSQALLADLRPATELERTLAQSIVDGHWRLNRMRTVEDGMFFLPVDETNPAPETGNSLLDSALLNEPQADRPHPRETRLMRIALGQARTFRAHSQSFGTLSLYEQRINRCIEKSMAQLRQLQAERRQTQQPQQPPASEFVYSTSTKSAPAPDAHPKTITSQPAPPPELTPKAA